MLKEEGGENGDLLALLLEEAHLVIAVLKFARKQLHPDDREHELQQEGHQHDVSDALDSHHNALHYVLQRERKSIFVTVRNIYQQSG